MYDVNTVINQNEQYSINRLQNVDDNTMNIYKVQLLLHFLLSTSSLSVAIGKYTRYTVYKVLLKLVLQSMFLIISWELLSVSQLKHEISHHNGI